MVRHESPCDGFRNHELLTNSACSPVTEILDRKCRKGLRAQRSDEIRQCRRRREAVAANLRVNPERRVPQTAGG